MGPLPQRSAHPNPGGSGPGEPHGHTGPGPPRRRLLLPLPGPRSPRARCDRRCPLRGRLRPHSADSTERDAELQELPRHVPQPHGVPLAAAGPPGHLPHRGLWGRRLGVVGALCSQLPAAGRPRERRCLWDPRPSHSPIPPAGPYCRNAVPAAPLLLTNSSAITVLFNSTSHRSGRGLLLSYASSQHPDLISCLVRGTHFSQEHVSVYCPAGCKDIEGDIWGNTKEGYRDTSVLCKAAVHAGVVADEVGGQVTLTREKGITLYESAFANGLHSKRGSLSEKRLLFHKACGDALEVAAFNASSWWQEVDALGQERSWAAERAALGTPSPSWAAEPGTDTAWLELDLGTRRNVTGIVTKGSAEIYDFYVTSYRVSSSRDGKNWRPYRGGSGHEDKVFEGNVDSLGEVSNAFIPPITTRYLRITPQSWHQRAALKVALLGCQMARVRAARPYVPSVPKEVPIHIPIPTSHPPGRTPIPGIALDPEKADSTLLVMLLIGVFVLLCSSLLLLAFLCRRRRKPATKLNCGLPKGQPKLEASQVCSLGSLPPPGSTLPSFPVVLGDLSQTHSPDYAEPDVVQVSPSSQLGSSTFKPPPDEGYTLPLVVSHYDVPGKHHEYAEPLPPEPEYATPFGEPEHAGARWNPSDTAGLPAAPSRAGSPGSPPARYVSPPLQLPGVSAAPRAERTAGPHRDGPHSQQLGDCPFSHVYHEAW
ncbi:discoidin, CUB and LCCL domain-containing protein 1-like isoform X2 [Gallus gallus]|uniref:discoidin, CUB and LCCL domain-containing protein 1-like isoform X2 n=1 Tax=Gallus gallus TaxID=9031 RepID=UPI001EFF7CF5|nr:discoidin, CUB and LCCL domain-containing protein 1-like isoform X2 [Gallus gallus]